MDKVSRILELIAEELSDVPVEVAYAVQYTLAKRFEAQCKELLPEVLKSVDAETGIYEDEAFRLKRVTKVNRSPRVGEIRAALDAAGIAEGEVFDWVHDLVLNPSRVNKLIAEGRLDGECMAPRETQYFLVKTKS